MNVKVEKITPEMAERYLSKNTVNRSLSDSKVRSYAIDMASDKWELNGEAIRFNKDGKLVDGQHRLAAIVKSGRSIRMVVMTDIDNDVSVYDRGRSRSITDQFQYSGMDKSLASNSNVAICRLHYYVQAGVVQIPDSLVKEFLLEHEKGLMVVRDCLKKSKAGRISVRNASAGLALLYAYESGFPEVTLKKWSNVVYEGFMESPADTAAIVYRNDVISGAIDASSSHSSKRKALHQTEKSLTDFYKGTGRKQSYANWDEPIFSNAEKFQKDAKKALIWKDKEEKA